MGVINTPLNPGSLRSMETRVGILEFETTEATVELATGMSKIYGATFTRLGGDDGDAAGVLSIDEDATIDSTDLNFIAGDGAGNITVVRYPTTNAGTLANEHWFYTVYGQTL